jgi:transglutaminase-like putative cysteine protease
LLERLEPRVLLASTPPSLVVGRTLSSYFVGQVQNSQETITYTVYNQQSDPETGVLLTTTLEPGVTFQSASQQPDISGQNLAWSFGTIQGFDRASVTLTVSLDSPTPIQLDTGAQAFATLDAGMVSASTPAAPLSTATPPDPSLLASTPDANTTDPYIQEKAAELGYDAQQIFNFLHTQIGYEAYAGSIRGARGTLWSSAGNALDIASLGVALMRASGIPAQYATGTISFGQAQGLILSMFPPSPQTVSYVAPGEPTSQPQNSFPVFEIETHYWFQFDTGSGMQDADPLLPGAAVGQTFTAATSTFAVVDDSLREKTEVQLQAEITSPGILGTTQATTTVLDHTFNDVDLVGRPLTIGHTVSQSARIHLHGRDEYVYAVHQDGRRGNAGPLAGRGVPGDPLPGDSDQLSLWHPGPDRPVPERHAHRSRRGRRDLLAHPLRSYRARRPPERRDPEHPDPGERPPRAEPVRRLHAQCPVRAQ